MEIEHNVELLRGTNEEWNGSDADRLIERGVLAYNRDSGELRVGPGTWSTCKPAGIEVDLGVDTAATSNVVIATAMENGDNVGGKVMVAGEFALLTAETDNTKNGPYVISTTGAATRHPDFATYDAIAGKCFHVTGGSNVGKVYRCISAAGGTLNTTPLLFVEVQPRVLHFGKLNQSAGITVCSTVIAGTKFFCEDPTTKDIQVVAASTIKTYMTS